mmetsp:Transcript_38475/g.96023  ORF Transcript_38475/g.96023 Transcript_38475/m.96023 type:complete len:251 (-) Transcript_38475:189-941(-)
MGCGGVGGQEGLGSIGPLPCPPPLPHRHSTKRHEAANQSDLDRQRRSLRCAASTPLRLASTVGRIVGSTSEDARRQRGGPDGGGDGGGDERSRRSHSRTASGSSSARACGGASAAGALLMIGIHSASGGGGRGVGGRVGTLTGLRGLRCCKAAPSAHAHLQGELAAAGDSGQSSRGSSRGCLSDQRTCFPTGCQFLIDESKSSSRMSSRLVSHPAARSKLRLSLALAGLSRGRPRGYGSISDASASSCSL